MQGKYGEMSHNNFKTFYFRLANLISGKAFILLTLTGNGFIVLSSLVFYLIESSSNPKVETFIDALWWAFATITTVGYGDIVPTTVAGRFLGIFCMIAGTGIFATFTALFANALLGREVHRLDERMIKLRKNVAGMQHEIEQDDESIFRALDIMKKSLDGIEQSLGELRNNQRSDD